MYITCKKDQLEHPELQEIVYKGGSTPDSFCHCVADAIGAVVDQNEYDVMVKSGVTPQSIADKYVHVSGPCVTLTSK